MDTHTHTQQAFALDIGQAFDQGFLMGYGESGDMDLLGSELDLAITSRDLEAFDQAAFSFLTDNRGTARAKIVDEHFLNQTEAAAFDILSEQIGTILNSKNNKHRAASIAFVFAAGEEELTFDLCCEALAVRPWVMRTRMMYEFYLNSTVFETFPRWNVPMGDALSNELYFVADEAGELLARIVWGMPSIPASAAIDQAVARYKHKGLSAAQFQESMSLLLQTGHFSLQTIKQVDRLYLTGRNPVLERYGFSKTRPKRRARGFYWSDLWVNAFL